MASKMSICSFFPSKKKTTKVKNDDEEEEVNKKNSSPENTIPQEPTSEHEEEVSQRNKSQDKTVPEESSSGAQEDNLNNPSKNNVRAFTYDELVSATNDFESLVGKGGFGHVYKGKIENQFVAVKKLDRSGRQGEKEYLAETHMLSILSHPNIVTMVGYCAEGDKRLLVYEYMPLNSLQKYLFEPALDKKPLDWNSRMKIALGVARGLEYLHNKVTPPVIYRDMKSANILLREGFHPKLSDFGLAVFGDKTYFSSRLIGTFGYYAPEYAETGKFGIKSDIYSFGMVLLELITGRKALDYRAGMILLVDWVKQTYKDKNNIQLICDPRLKGKYPKASLGQALEMALMCLRDDVEKRPPMTEVLMGLEYLESQKYHNPNEDDDPNEDTSTNMDMSDSYPIEFSGMFITQPRAKEPESEPQPTGAEYTNITQTKGKAIAPSSSSTAEF